RIRTKRVRKRPRIGRWMFIPSLLDLTATVVLREMKKAHGDVIYNSDTPLCWNLSSDLWERFTCDRMKMEFLENSEWSRPLTKQDPLTAPSDESGAKSEVESTQEVEGGFEEELCLNDGIAEEDGEESE